MISEELFLEKIRELAHMKLVNIPVAAAKDVYRRFRDFEEPDLNRAIDLMIHSEDRFDFSRLLKHMVHRRADRLEGEAEQNRLSEGEAAIRFFNESSYSGDCRREVCRGCGHIKDCKVRGREWIKGINAIWRGDLGKEEGEKFINFMQKEFMGGIK